MFGKLIDNYKARRAIKNIEQHPVLGAVLCHLREVVNDRSEGIGKHWSDDGKQQLVSQILAEVEQQLMQPNPVQAIRMRLIEFMLLAASFDVLVMQPPTRFIGISGELKQYIPQLRKVDQDLETFFYGLDEQLESFDEMWDAILARYWVVHLHMSAFNIARVSIGDYHSDRLKDWFRPCYVSFCIWQENNYRVKLGLPPALEGPMADLKAIMYSAWIHRAQEGHKELRLEWERSWQEAFEENSPFLSSAVEI